MENNKNRNKLTAEIIIRSGKIEDIKELIKLTRRCELYDKHIDDPKKIKRKISSDPDGLIIAIDSNQQKIIGTVSLIEDGRMAYLYRIAVNPDFQGKGIGTELVKEGLQRLRMRGHDEVILFVDENSKDLQKKFYERSLKFQYEDTYRCMYLDF